MRKILFATLCLASSVACASTNPFYTTLPLDKQLTVAISKDDSGQVAYLLREMRVDPNFYLPNGETPLVWAIKNDAKVTTEKVLLKSVRIKINTPTLREKTPLI